MIDDILSGAAFGAALAASNVHQPKVIIMQFKLENFLMLTTFLTAMGSSTIIVTSLRKLGYIDIPPRKFSSVGWFGALDGNIAGGFILGSGMALAGSCPGTIFPQLGVRIPSGLYTLLGAILGGITWSGFLSRWMKPPAKEPVSRRRSVTLSDVSGLGQAKTVILLEIMIVATIGAVLRLLPPEASTPIHPVIGGLLIGGAQLLSLTTRKMLLGTSTSFEECGNFFWWIVKGCRPGSMTHYGSYKTIVFASGMVLGTWCLSLAHPQIGSTGWPVTEIQPIRAVLGGVLMAIGSRMAGGCTSGHGISGLSLLSTASLISVVAMFAGGIATSVLCA